MVQLRKNMGLISLLTIVAIALLLGFFYNSSQAQLAKNENDSYEVQANQEDVKISISADGQAVYSLINLRFNANGVLKELFVVEGQGVKKNQVLAKLDINNLENLVKQAQANYNASIAKIKKIQAGASPVEKQTKQAVVENARRNLELQQQIYDGKLELFNEGAISKSEILADQIKLESAKGLLDTAVNQLEGVLYTDLNDLAVAKETAEQTKAALAIAKNNLAEAVLKAPEDGIVISSNGTVGEFISSTSGVASLITLANPAKLTVEAKIFEDDLAKIHIGQGVEVSFTAMPEEVFYGKVTSVSLSPQTDQNGIITYTVRVLLDKYDERIKNGMTATVDFIIQQAKAVVTIPVEAVKRVEGSPAVEVKNKDNSTNWQKIKAGLTDGKIVEIREGLKVGETVVIRKVVKTP